MKKDGVQPNTFCYNIFISALSKALQKEEMLAIYVEMKAAGVPGIINQNSEM